MSDDGKTKWEQISVTPEEVKRMLDEREDGRKAGLGDSPWTQEFYEETYGINIGKRDWILSGVLESGSRYSDFGWFLSCARSRMEPLIRKYSLARELIIKAEEIRLCMERFGEGLPTHMNRLDFIVEKAVKDGLDSGYGKEPLSGNDLNVSEQDRRKFYRQARQRFFNRIERLKRYKHDGEDEDFEERIMARSLIFEAAYLCLRCKETDTAYSLFLEECQNRRSLGCRKRNAGRNDGCTRSGCGTKQRNG